jgi:hypothetical protein
VVKSKPRTPEQKLLAWAQTLKKNHNLTPEQWNAVHVYQKGVCACCGKPTKSGKRLCTDHRHKDGLNRGLLDAACNKLLGIIEGNRHKLGWEDIARLAEYMRNPPFTVVLGHETFGWAGRLGTKRQAAHLRRERKKIRRAKRLAEKLAKKEAKRLKREAKRARRLAKREAERLKKIARREKRKRRNEPVRT